MEEQIAYLKRVDPILRAALKTIQLKKRTWPKRPSHFKSLVTAIVNQQLSGKAAATILNRFVALFDETKFPTPQAVLAMPAAKMRKAGLSKMKVSFLKDLAKHVVNKSLDFKKMDRWTDEEVIEHLVRVKGIGRWTAEMFLMSSLRRDDVFSYGDLGLRNGMKKLYKLKGIPTPAQAAKISSKWKPYRSLASRILWASLDS